MDLKKLIIVRFVFISLLFIVYGVLIIFCLDFNINISRDQEYLRIQLLNAMELVPDKPLNNWIVYSDNVNFYDSDGKKIGELMNNPVVYSSDSIQPINETLMYVQVYGWVWNNCIFRDSVLLVTESLKNRANSQIIFRLNSDTELKMKSHFGVDYWELCSLSGYISKRFLLTYDEYREMPIYKKLFSIGRINETNTKAIGGIYFKPVKLLLIKYKLMNWPLRLIFSVLTFSFLILLTSVFYLPRRFRKNKRKWRVILFFLLIGMDVAIISKLIFMIIG